MGTAAWGSARTCVLGKSFESRGGARVAPRGDRELRKWFSVLEHGIVVFVVV